MIGDLAAAQELMPDTHKEKQLQACKGCRLIMSESQWKRVLRNGDCPNAGHISHQEEHKPTHFFNGMISLFMPNNSWVSKWNGLEGVRPGIYAISIMEEADDLHYEEQEQRKSKKRRNKMRDDYYSEGEETPGSEFD